MFIVVFDLDGTLIDTSHDLISAANQAAQQFGLGAQLEYTEKALAMRGGRAMIRVLTQRAGHAVDEAQIDQMYPPFITLYEAIVADHARLYDGALEAVAWCRAQGYGVAICTNKPAKPTHILLAALGISDLFDAVVAADTLPVKKPDPAPLFHAINQTARAQGTEASGAVLIGDTITDVSTAQAAGVPVVLVDFDQPSEELRQMGADAVILDYAELPPILEFYAKGSGSQDSA